MIHSLQGGQGNKGRYRSDFPLVHRMREARSESVPERRSPGRISGTAGVKILEGSANEVKARGLFEDSAGKAVQREPPIQRDCSRSPLMMMTARIASQKRAARMRFTRGFMVFENRLLWPDQMDHPCG